MTYENEIEIDISRKGILSGLAANRVPRCADANCGIRRA